MKTIESSEEIIWPEFDCEGVSVIRETRVVLGSDFGFVDGRLVDREAEYYTVYLFNNSEYDTIEEVRTDLTSLIETAILVGCTAQDMVDSLNNSHDEVYGQ